MKRLLKEIVYKDIAITEYSAVTIENGIQEKVFFQTNHSLIDVTTNQWLLCLEPVIFGIWFTKENSIPIDETESYTLLFEEQLPKNKTKNLAKAKLRLVEKIEEQEGTLWLLKLEDCTISHISLFESLFIFYRHYSKPGFPFKKLKAYASAYSYPRKVRIISFRQPGYFNIFPMDLMGPIEGTNRFVFGLRHTNQALERIIKDKKLLVSEVPFEHKEDIYKLGKHHSAAPPSLDKLSFSTSPSRDFGFPVPEWAQKYNEIRIIKTLDLGSHMLMWGESQHEKIINTPSPSLYHIHFLLYLFQKRKAESYRLV